MKKLITSILTFTLVLFTLGATTFAWWNILTVSEVEQELQIGQRVSITKTSQDLDYGEGKDVLVPMGQADFSNQSELATITFNFDIEGEETTEHWLNASVQSFEITYDDGGNEVTIDLNDDIFEFNFDFEFEKEDVGNSGFNGTSANSEMSTGEGTYIVIVSIRMNGNEDDYTQGILDHIVNEELTFTFDFELLGTDPN